MRVYISCGYIYIYIYIICGYIYIYKMGTWPMPREVALAGSARAAQLASVTVPAWRLR
jgi:hypothetical protein